MEPRERERRAPMLMRQKDATLARALRNRIETIMSGLAKRGLLECRSFQRIIISREYTPHYRYSGFDEYCMETVRAAAPAFSSRRPLYVKY